MKKFKRVLAALLVMIMVLQPAAFAASVADFLDFPFGWSKDAMTAAVENGLYIGNESKLIQPDKALTRAELAAFITRAFGATRTADLSKITDVNADDWFYEPVAKAYQMGAITGTSDTTFDPNSYITREQVFLVLARVLCISGTNEQALDRFTDADKISSWAKNGIIGMAEKSYVNGYPDGSFRPQDNITRAELAQVFHNIFKLYIDAPGYYSQVPESGSVMIRVPGVHLENVTVNGDVVIADGVANGDFDLASVNVNGRVLARGGEGKVTFKSVTVGEKVVVYDLNGTVNFNNYRTDPPFKRLDEITPATFLKKPEPSTGGSTGGGGGGGKTTFYTIVLRDEDGAELDKQTVKAGSVMTKPTDPTKAHYTFVHWSRTKGGEAFDVENTKINASFSLYAVYEKNPIVSFYLNTTDTTPFATQEIAYNSTAASPSPAPEKEGYTFLNEWTLKDGTKFDLSTKRITQNTSLYAVFSVNEYAVIFYEEEYDASNPNPTVWKDFGKKAYGSVIRESEFPAAPASPDPAKTFKGWTVNGGTEFVTYPYTVGLVNKFYPVFSDKETFKVTFYVDGTEFASKTVFDGDAVTAVTAPVKTGYTFKHWSETENGITAFDFSKGITKETKLYAVYEKNTYEVIFYKDTAATDPMLTVRIGFENTVAEPTDKPAAPDGFYFDGWALKGTTAKVTFPYAITAKTEFVPIFTKEPPVEQVTVTFYDMDGTTVLGTQKLPKGTKFTKPADPAEKTGYTFKHWSLTKGGEEAEYDIALTKDIDLYAVYEKNTYEVIFYKDTAATAPMLTVSIGFEDTVAEPTDKPAAPDGFYFDGWALKGTTAKVTFPYAITAKTEFVPIFKSISPSEEVTVTFIADGTTVKTVTLTKGTAIGTANMPENPTKEHYTFEGWFTKENGEGTQVTAATVVTEDTTVYAFLKAELLTVSFYDVTRYDNGDDPLLKVIHIPYNTSVNQLLASDPAITIPANTTTEGFKRNASVARIYGTMGIDTTHILSSGWWVINGRAWEKFDMDAPVTANVKVYDNVKEVKLIVGMSRLSTIPLTVYANYDENTRAIDTVKDALFISESTVKTALNGDVGKKVLEQMVNRGVIDNATDKNIRNVHRYVKLVNVIGEANIRKMISEVVDDSIKSEDSKQYIYDYIRQYLDKIAADQDKAVTVLTPVFNDLLAGSSGDTFRAILQSIADEALTPGAVTIGTSVDETIVREIVAFIADDANSTYRDELTDAMFNSLDGQTLIDIAADLGQTTADTRSKYVNQLIAELCDKNGTDVTVTEDRLFMFEPIYKMLSTHGWDFFEAKIPERAKALLPLADIKKLFDRHYDPYVNGMKTAMESAKADPTATFYIGNGVQVDINPISDILTPMLNYVKDMKAYAEGKAPTVTKEAFIKYYPYYENNPFKDAYEEFMETEKWVSGTDNGYTADLSGYKLHSFAAYYDILKALAVVLDDTMSWYYDDANVPAADREDVFAIAEDKVLAVANMLDRFLVDYAVNGIPKTLTDLCLDIENDPTMIEIIKKFGVEKYLEKLENNATAGKVYDTVYDKINARFGARIDAILDRLYKSKLNRYYDDAEYQKGKEILHGLFTDKVEDQYTVDTIFDKFLKGADQKEEEFNGITIELLRHIFYSVERIEKMHAGL
mgnify:CR=1 FL=1